MRKRNRKVKKNSRLASGSWAIVSLIVMGFIMLMVCCNLEARCGAIADEIGAAEKTMAALEREYSREMVRWEGMKTPEKLTDRLLRSGLDMRFSRPEQVVRMTKGGVPAPGQISVARANLRSQLSTVAQLQPAPAKRNNKKTVRR